ncbi:DUF2975 domain-containing protein [Winogradskyella aurantia]|uniref:DUF2975 domain-containing protein n=1 Tax=Winogradskyella aurantia TaxID=1915063 RepID=A0A265UZE1_9FLAO|nr:DUF2975 domain-containing protein [Winogradskyella aurantia]OZV70684.1 hypothetical protein CA834_00795 [Winogradskyella aurantia]
MRKLVILKSLVDFIWIVTCIPGIPLLLFFMVFVFINPDSVNFVIDTGVSKTEASTLQVQLIALVLVVLCFIGIYCLYLFRKTLRYFQQVKPFHEDVIANFYKIGYLLSGIGISALMVFFLARLFVDNKFRIQLGISSYLLIVCLGLFFMVLSEVFKVAKHAKEENELTV